MRAFGAQRGAMEIRLEVRDAVRRQDDAVLTLDDEWARDGLE